MTKPKQILPNEEFIIEGYLWKYSLVDNKVKFTPLQKYDGKVKKEKKVKKDFDPPLPSEVITYFIEKGYTQESACKFFDYYDAAEWKDGKGNQVKNWKQKAVGVWFVDANKIKEVKDTSNTKMVR